MSRPPHFDNPKKVGCPWSLQTAWSTPAVHGAARDQRRSQLNGEEQCLQRAWARPRLHAASSSRWLTWYPLAELRHVPLASGSWWGPSLSHKTHFSMWPHPERRCPSDDRLLPCELEQTSPVHWSTARTSPYRYQRFLIQLCRSKLLSL